MNADEARELARRGELYPGVILHGATEEVRRGVALDLARILLCAAPAEERPCGTCRHCRRISPSEPAGATEVFHPDLRILERDLKTSTSVDATKAFLRTAQVSPFEARGQVFVIANAETLSGEAANALLKTLEEPHASAPRHFLLLAPSRLDLLPTLRSRSLSVYLGPAESLPDDEVEPLAEDLAGCLAGWVETGSPVWLLTAASVIESAGDWSDPRAERSWALGARALLSARARIRSRIGDRSGSGAADDELERVSRGVLAAAEDLLNASAYRLRAIPAGRILDGILARRLTAAEHAPAAARLAAPRGRR